MRLAGRKTAWQTAEELALKGELVVTSHHGVPQNVLEPQLNNNKTQISSRTAKLSGEKIKEPAEREDLCWGEESGIIPGLHPKRTINNGKAA